MQTQVYLTGAPRHDMVGQRLPSYLTITPETISKGLAQRILAYASKRLAEAGFEKLISTWTTSVYTLDADKKQVNRAYTVKFQNDKGGYIEVSGIYTQNGWPFLDYGYAIGHDSV